MSQEPQRVRPVSVFAGFLSYLVPGLGQISQGRTGKGILFMVCLLSLFHVGEALGNWQNVYVPADGNHNIVKRTIDLPVNLFNQRWHFAGQVWIGVAAWPALWQYYGGPMPSGDTSPFLSNYQKQPEEGSIDKKGTVNNFLVNSDKTPDLGWIYTVIAGMLNILVIYDAYAGPAYGPRIPREAVTNVPAREAARS